MLPEVQKLYGKLLHAACIVPLGQAYLTNFESMLGIFKDHPFLPRTPPCGTQEDLSWWRDPQLSSAVSSHTQILHCP
jgi:hypothetical protein